MIGSNWIAARPYGLAIAVTLLALLARLLLDPFLGDHLPYISFLLATAVLTSYVPLGPSLATVILGGLGANYFFASPRYSFALSTSAHYIGSATYVVAALTMVGFGQALQRARRHAETVAEGLRQEAMDRVKAEAALQESEFRFRSVADNIAQLAWMADASGEIFWYNRRWYEYTGTSFEAMQGWGWKTVHHPDHVDRVEAKWRESLGTGEPWEDTFPLRSKDGTYRWFLSRALPIGNAEQHIERWFGTNTDITELRDTQASLSKSEQQLQAFATELEHRVEERTKELLQSQRGLRVLTTELNLAEQRERKRLAVELHDHLAQWLVVCQLNLGRMRRIGLPAQVEQTVAETEEVLGNALNYSRTLMAELSPYVLQEHGLVAGIKWLGAQFLRHHLSVTVHEESAIPHRQLSDDTAVLVFQSVRELMMNTLKHAQTNEMTIHIGEHQGQLRIVVQDKGVGFDADRTSQTDTDVMSSKFGLFSIRERMKTIGGHVEIRSAPGEGTTAVMTLPIESPDEDLADTERAEFLPEVPSALAPGGLGASAVGTHHAVKETDRIRILLVDDHSMVRQGLRTVLDSYPDLEVVGEAADGLDAVAVAERLRPEVVLMDINMPRMNGIEATEQIKTRHPTTVIIGLSVNADRENRQAITKAGAVMLLTKEAAVEELYSAICTSIRNG
jgi:PAS domain S-box-containing protein